MQLRDLFAEVPLPQGRVVPLAFEQLLRSDLDASADWRLAEQVLLRARDALPEYLEIAVALYKLYAYSNRFDEALEVIDEVLAAAAASEGFSADWRDLESGSTVWNPATGNVRHYLYSLKATGFVCLRRGEVERAFEVLGKLRELDPLDQVGGSVVYELASGLLEEE